MPQTPNQQVKQQHLDLIRELMRQHTSATKGELSRLSGLSVVTLGSLIAQLERSGEVVADAVLPSGGGRPACVYRYNADHRHALALCVAQQGESYDVMLSTVNLQGKTLSSQRLPLGPSPCGTLLDAAAAACAGDPLIASIAVGIPGQAVEGKVLLCDVEPLTGLWLEALLRDRTGLPIRLENDMNATVYGCQLHEPAGDGCEVGVYFPNGKGPGAGILVNGRLLRGMDGMAGELGHLPVWMDAPHAPEPSAEIILNCLQTLTAVLSPTRIVLYREGLDPAAFERFFHSRWPAVMPRPEITVRQTILPHYELGVQRLALERLWPAAALPLKGRDFV